ncbi:MAG: antitoxin [Deltaproteobacteria bacterium]|nr:antitoxin [Deltaproteobacteria bacterium]
MRTTLTLDPDVAALLEQEAHRLRQPFKQVVNDALRRGLTRRPQRKKRLQVEVHHARLQAGIDPGHLNRLADELEDEALLGKPGR